jgi:hypothetical protein
MTCSEEFSTLCGIFSTSVIVYTLYNYSSVLEFIINGSGKGIIRVNGSKRNAVIDTTGGVLTIPSVKLPSLDWSVSLFEYESTKHIKDGLNSLDIISDVNTIDCKIRGRTLLTEFVYPEDLGVEKIRGCISSIFDNECFVFTIEPGDMIDYRKYANQFMLLLEDL